MLCDKKGYRQPSALVNIRFLPYKDFFLCCKLSRALTVAPYALPVGPGTCMEPARTVYYS